MAVIEEYETISQKIILKLIQRRFTRFGSTDTTRRPGLPGCPFYTFLKQSRKAIKCVLTFVIALCTDLEIAL